MHCSIHYNITLKCLEGYTGDDCHPIGTTTVQSERAATCRALACCAEWHAVLLRCRLHYDDGDGAADDDDDEGTADGLLECLCYSTVLCCCSASI